MRLIQLKKIKTNCKYCSSDGTHQFNGEIVCFNCGLKAREKRKEDKKINEELTLKRQELQKQLDREKKEKELILENELSLEISNLIKYIEVNSFSKEMICFLHNLSTKDIINGMAHYPSSGESESEGERQAYSSYGVY